MDTRERGAGDVTASEVAAFNLIYRQHAPRLVGYACRLVPRDVAEDIVHDVFVAVWREKKYTIPAAEIRFFLYRCVLNGCKNHLKHLSRRGAQEPTAEAELRAAEIDFLEAHLERTAGEDLLARVHAAIEKLPPRCRAIFEQAYLHRKKSGEIAAEMNLSRRTVEAQLYKALKILRNSLLFFSLRK